jgi:hypothetical protein
MYIQNLIKDKRSLSELLLFIKALTEEIFLFHLPGFTVRHIFGHKSCWEKVKGKGKDIPVTGHGGP